MEIKVIHGDITRIKAEAIVNAANKRLIHGGGVALAIAKAALGDPREYTIISREFMKKQLGKEEIEHGEVVWTPSYELRKNGVKYIIHTVGPICNGKWDDEKREKLEKAIMGALKKADELGVKTIAFPAISTGIYGCPFERFLEVFKDCISKFESENIETVYLVLFKKDQFEKAKEFFRNT